MHNHIQPQMFINKINTVVNSITSFDPMKKFDDAVVLKGLRAKDQAQIFDPRIYRLFVGMYETFRSKLCNLGYCRQGNRLTKNSG